MLKNEGTAGQGRPNLGTTKTEVPKEQPPTYSELGINYKDASRWQQMAENKRGFATSFPFFVPLNEVLSPLSKEKYLLIMQSIIFGVYGKKYQDTGNFCKRYEQGREGNICES